MTIISQDALLSTFDKILGALTYTVGGIAAISLAVAGILIMNVMLVAVSQRVAEIGLLKAWARRAPGVAPVPGRIGDARRGRCRRWLIAVAGIVDVAPGLSDVSDRRAVVGDAGRGRWRSSPDWSSACCRHAARHAGPGARRLGGR